MTVEGVHPCCTKGRADDVRSEGEFGSLGIQVHEGDLGERSPLFSCIVALQLLPMFLKRTKYSYIQPLQYVSTMRWITNDKDMAIC